MSKKIEYSLNKATEAEIAEHLFLCSVDFVPPLSDRVEIKDYAKKIVTKSTRFEAWGNGALVGLLAAYCNDPEKRIAYVTSVSILSEWRKKGISTRLITNCIEQARKSGMHRISLEVARENILATQMYKKNGFTAAGNPKSSRIIMDKILKRSLA
jgi:ribosomal protein S18 acetylase RimI-like enzyme